MTTSPAPVAPLGELSGTYTLDVAHTRIGFVARHAMVTKVRGGFDDFSGSAVLDAANPAASSAHVVIRTASVNTRNAQRDAHLRSQDFLAVDDHPQLQFSSTRFAVRAGNAWTIDGDLTIRGRTNDVRLDTTYLGTQTWNGTRVGATATTSLHREHFTLNWQQMVARGVPVVGSTIEINLDVQAVLQQ